MITRKISYRILFLVLVSSMAFSAYAQDSIMVTIPFYFEDGVGNKDTVIIIISDHQNDSTNAALSSENTVAVPFDSVFEVRASDFYSLARGILPRFTYKKQVIKREFRGQDSRNCGNWIMDDFISFTMNVKYPPLKVSWDPSAFADGSPFNCMAESSWIINSMAPNTLWPWWDNTREGFTDYQCMATDSVKIFYPFDQGGELSERLFYTYTFLPIEGSPNPVDTIELINVYFSRPGFEPCFTRVDTDSPVLTMAESMVYPNPAGELLYWRAENSDKVRTFSVYSVAGQRMAVSALPGGAIDISRLPVGAYFLRLDYADGHTVVNKFLKW